VAFGRDDTTPLSIWVHDLSRGNATPATFDAYAWDPVWSRDGKQIAFASARGSPPNLFLTKPGTSAGDERLTQSTLEHEPFDFSPDGNFLVYGVDDASTRQDIWLLPLTGDRQPKPVINTPFNERSVRISPKRAVDGLRFERVWP
jgi:Tol biopolymer transport system component